jgi:hypothetical protein
MHWFDRALHACAKVLYAVRPTDCTAGVTGLRTSACECGLRWTVAELFESSLSHASVRAARAAWRRRTIDGVMSTEIDVDGSYDSCAHRVAQLYPVGMRLDGDWGASASSQRVLSAAVRRRIGSCTQTVAAVRYQD